jgi:hypothetical protein
LTKPAVVQPLPRLRPNGAEREAHFLVAEVARKLADLQDTIKDLARRFPNQRAILREFIAKVRSDLAFLEKRLGGS